MNFKILLAFVGVSLFLFGLLGMLFFGPTQQLSIFKNSFWMNYFEIYSFSGLGIMGIAGYYLLTDKTLIKWLAFSIIVLAALTPVVRFFQTGLS